MILRGREGARSARVATRRHALTGALRGGAAIAVVGGGLAVLGLATGFHVSDVQVQGAPKPQAERLRSQIRRAVGSQSLLRVDADGLAATLESLPDVRAVRVDRAFPGTLAVHVSPEVPAAVVPLGSERYLVARSGRVIGPAAARTPLPFLAAAPADVPPPGGTITAPGVLAELDVARAIEKDLGLRLVAVETGADGLLARTRQGVQVRLGDVDDLGDKLAAAAAALSAIPSAERRGAAYVDVTVADRPAVRTAAPNEATLAPPAPIQLEGGDVADAATTAAEGATTDATDDATDPSLVDDPALEAALAPDVPAIVQDLFGRAA